MLLRFGSVLKPFLFRHFDRLIAKVLADARQ
jgi:hypothetical protein